MGIDWEPDAILNRIVHEVRTSIKEGKKLCKKCLGRYRLFVVVFYSWKWGGVGPENALLLVFVVLCVVCLEACLEELKVRLARPCFQKMRWYSCKVNIGSCRYKYFLSRWIPSIMIRPLSSLCLSLSLSLSPLLFFDILLTWELVVMLRVMLRMLTRPIHRPWPSFCPTRPRLHWERGGEVVWCSGRHCFIGSCEASPVLRVGLVRSVRGEFGGCDVAWGFGGTGIGVYESQWSAGVVGWC